MPAGPANVRDQQLVHHSDKGSNLAHQLFVRAEMVSWQKMHGPGVPGGIEASVGVVALGPLDVAAVERGGTPLSGKDFYAREQEENA